MGNIGKTYINTHTQTSEWRLISEKCCHAIRVKRAHVRRDAILLHIKAQNYSPYTFRGEIRIEIIAEKHERHACTVRV